MLACKAPGSPASMRCLAATPSPPVAQLCISAQAKLAGKLRRHILPPRGIRVFAAELAKGSEAIATAAVVLLRERSELQFLQLYLEANGIQAVQLEPFYSVGAPYHKHIGGPITGISVRASPRFGRLKEPAHDWVAVRGANGALWFGRLVAFVCTGASSSSRKCQREDEQWAFLRWLEQAPQTALLRWCSRLRQMPDGSRRQAPYYDLVHIVDIKPVCMQEDPTADEHFFIITWLGADSRWMQRCMHAALPSVAGRPHCAQLRCCCHLWPASSIFCNPQHTILLLFMLGIMPPVL